MNDFTKEYTQREFAHYSFKDDYGQECSIQKSSSSEEDKIWIGCDSGTHNMGKCLARMHLTKDIAKNIVNILNRFIETGEIDE